MLIGEIRPTYVAVHLNGQDLHDFIMALEAYRGRNDQAGRVETLATALQLTVDKQRRLAHAADATAAD